MDRESGIRQRKVASNKSQNYQSNRQGLVSKANTDNKVPTSSNDAEAQKQMKKSVTSSLERTKEMMRSELERVSHVSNVIHTDGKALEQTRDEQLEINDAGKGAKGSLQRLKLQEKQESMVFWSSVVFFYLVVLYIVWSRIRIPFLLW